MLSRILGAFDQQHEFKDVWELKLIKFDIDLDEDVKPYQRYLAISHNVEDSKGNPGIKGHFFITNLRVIWNAASDRDLNLSVGLDTINKVDIKPITAQGGTVIKNILILKTQSPNNTRYQFRFSGISEQQLLVFRRLISVHKQAQNTTLCRNIDTNLKMENRKFIPIPQQEIKSHYPQAKFYDDDSLHQDVQIYFTDVRIVIVYAGLKKGISYGIPWIMISSYQQVTKNQHRAIELHVRGILRQKEFFIRVKNFNVFYAELNSFSQTYTKNPKLGISLKQTVTLNQMDGIKKQDEFVQIQQAKINLKRNKNAYTTQSTQGSLSNTFYCEQLGLMMQKLPQGQTRASLWQILRT